MEPDKNKKIGYFIGQAIAYVLAACIGSLIIAASISLTIKLITWIF